MRTGGLALHAADAAETAVAPPRRTEEISSSNEVSFSTGLFKRSMPFLISSRGIVVKVGNADAGRFLARPRTVLRTSGTMFGRMFGRLSGRVRADDKGAAARREIVKGENRMIASCINE